MDDDKKKIFELEKKLKAAEEKIFWLERKNFELNKKISELKKISVENLPGEIWRDVLGYEGLYQVSNKGRVKSFHDDRIKILKNCESQNYLNVMLAKNGNNRSFRVHRLVAMAFIPNPENLPEVNHKDGNKKNNCVENLEWMTSSENSIHALKIGLSKQSYEHFKAKFTAEEIKFIRENYKPRDKKFGMGALSRKFNVSRGVIWEIIHKRTYKNID